MRREEYTRRVVRSSLWAAAGDAVGWITELAKSERSVSHRTGGRAVDRPVDWKRKIGGRSGVSVDLPAGTYSDDTQLRLAVCRAMRGDGVFDVEAFAKVELTAWQGYHLGAGVGTLAAASHLARTNVNWFSNTFVSKKRIYASAGGNGAAMRVQPHVWVSGGDTDMIMRSAFRDAIVTHGHPHGFCGAIFHALCLRDAIDMGGVPPIGHAHSYVDRLSDLPRLAREDSELSSFWIGNWEANSNAEIEEAVYQFQSEASADIEDLIGLDKGGPEATYHAALDMLGCLTPAYRGSGFKTALAALVLANLFPKTPEDALLVAAHELQSDTDTIATMAGAILGAVAESEPRWAIQDRDYIETEALRLANIASGDPVRSFSYPDLATWRPPANHSDAVGAFEGGLALRGLGRLAPIGREYASSSAIWQWCELGFGQTVLVKRRKGALEDIDGSQLPGHDRPRPKFPPKRDTKVAGAQDQGLLPLLDTPGFSSIDEATQAIIRSNFDNETIGRLLNACIEETESVESAIAMSAIIAKAKIARRKGKA